MTVGQKLKAKIMEHNDHGAVVALSPTVNGFVQSLHLVNSSVSNPHLKCPIGQSFNARILRHVTGQSPKLTLKKDLVKSTLPPVTTIDASNVEIVTIGTVVKQYDSGLLIELFGDAKTFIPLKEIPNEFRENLFDRFPVGLVVECRIISVDLPNKRMTSSLYLTKESKKGEQRKAIPASDTLNVSDVVSCVVRIKKKDRIIVAVKGHKKINASILLQNLSDDSEDCKSVLRRLKKGELIRTATVIAKDSDAYLLSLKSKDCCEDEARSSSSTDVMDKNVSFIHMFYLQISSRFFYLISLFLFRIFYLNLCVCVSNGWVFWGFCVGDLFLLTPLPHI